MTVANRHVTHRDGGREGEPDGEPDHSPMKDAQRDLTSLSSPVRRNGREARRALR